MVELLKFATESISNYFATIAMIFVIAVGMTAVLFADAIPEFQTAIHSFTCKYENGTFVLREDALVASIWAALD
jgi:hypothetical protein